jgi:hypothetical protein
MGEYTPEEFDRQVAALRGTVDPRQMRKRKSDCTPAEWAAHLDYKKSSARQWRAGWDDSRRETKSKSDKRWKNSNSERNKQNKRRWQLANQDKNREGFRRWREKNKEKHRDGFRRWHERAMQTDAGYRIACNLRRRLSMAIKDGAKSGSAVRDLGCTIAELWSHLESKFQPGMTRENMGTAWHLDHIYPLAKADLQDRSQFLAVNNWRNIQPLLPADNIAKNDKVLPEAQALFDQLCAEFA